jgi:hypothetical protein
MWSSGGCGGVPGQAAESERPRFVLDEYGPGTIGLRCAASGASSTGAGVPHQASSRSGPGRGENRRALDFPAPSPQGATLWRRATLIAATLAALELAVIVVAGVTIFGKTVAKHVERAAVARVFAPAKTTAIPLDAPAGTAHLPRSQTVVTVLNGGAPSGAAATQAQAVRGLGYMIGQVGNAPHPALHTVVEYGPGYRAEAARLASDLHVKAVSPLDGLRRSDLLGAQVALILGT